MSLEFWNTDWSEKAEVEFINGIGTHSEYATRIPVIELLEGYRASLDHRVDWAGMSKYDIYKAIDIRIEMTKEGK